nr:MAG TPA: hypothetical protein [Bacteriophage sp.]
MYSFAINILVLLFIANGVLVSSITVRVLPSNMLVKVSASPFS